MKSPNINILPDLKGISHAAAAEFLKIGNAAIEENDRFTVALAGGSTPRKLYEYLASDKYNSDIDWEKVFFFFGDERDVSPASNQSNFKMASEFLFKPLGINKSNIFRWQTEIIDAPGIADQYEKTIRKFFGLKAGEFPRFDLTLLGMGEDGHTASLFPRTGALNETAKITAANLVKQIRSFRLTRTFPTINNPANILLLVSGEGKAKTLQKVLENDFDAEKFPVQCIKPENGKLTWLVDEAAAQFLK